MIKDNIVYEKFEKEQTEEAIRRIKELTKKYDLNSNMLDYFQNDLLHGVDFTDSQDEKLLYKCSEVVQSYLKEHKHIVYYYCISWVKADNEKYRVLNIFYVSGNKDEWETERIADGNYIIAYVFNFDEPDFSEFGDIWVEPINGELSRKY